MTEMNKKPLNVYTLMGHNFFQMSLTCLKSFCEHCKDNYILKIYDDGTLTESDKELLRTTLSLDNSSIINDNESYDLIKDQIKKYTYIRKYRNSDFLAKKLIDIPLLSQDNYCYVDTDIYFVKDFFGFDRTHVPSEDLVKMFGGKDVTFLTFHERYIGKNKLRLPAKLNSGMAFVKKETFSLDIIEKYLELFELKYKKPKNNWRYWLVEQTCWAALSTHLNSYYWDLNQVYIPKNENNISNETIALHFITPIRHLFKDMVEKSNKFDDGDPVELKTIPIRYNNIINASLGAIRKKLIYTYKGLMQ